MTVRGIGHHLASTIGVASERGRDGPRRPPTRSAAVQSADGARAPQGPLLPRGPPPGAIRAHGPAPTTKAPHPWGNTTDLPAHHGGCPWPSGPSPWPMSLRGYHLIRPSIRFVPYKGPRGRPSPEGSSTPRWAGRRPRGPWRTSPSPTPGPLPPDGGDAEEGPGRSAPFPEPPPTERRVVPPHRHQRHPLHQRDRVRERPTAQGDQEPRPLPSSDKTAVEPLRPPDPQQRPTRPRASQRTGQTRQQTNRPTPPHTTNRRTNPSTNPPPPTPTGPPPTSNPHTQKNRQAPGRIASSRRARGLLGSQRMAPRP